jgi:hypothetical protein
MPMSEMGSSEMGSLASVWPGPDHFRFTHVRHRLAEIGGRLKGASSGAADDFRQGGASR